MGMFVSHLMGKHPSQKLFIVFFTGGQLQNDIRQFSLGVGQLHAVQCQKDQHGVCADPLVPVHKRMVPDQTVAEPGCLLLK